MGILTLKPPPPSLAMLIFFRCKIFSWLSRKSWSLGRVRSGAMKKKILKFCLSKFFQSISKFGNKKIFRQKFFCRRFSQFKKNKKKFSKIFSKFFKKKNFEIFFSFFKIGQNNHKKIFEKKNFLPNFEFTQKKLENNVIEKINNSKLKQNINPSLYIHSVNLKKFAEY